MVVAVAFVASSVFGCGASGGQRVRAAARTAPESKVSGGSGLKDGYSGDTKTVTATDLVGPWQIGARLQLPNQTVSSTPLPEPTGSAALPGSGIPARPDAATMDQLAEMRARAGLRHIAAGQLLLTAEEFRLLAEYGVAVKLDEVDQILAIRAMAKARDLLLQSLMDDPSLVDAYYSDDRSFHLVVTQPAAARVAAQAKEAQVPVVIDEVSFTADDLRLARADFEGSLSDGAKGAVIGFQYTRDGLLIRLDDAADHLEEPKSVFKSMTWTVPAHLSIERRLVFH